MIVDNNVNLAFNSKIKERDIQLILMQELSCYQPLAHYLLADKEKDEIVVTEVWHSKREVTKSGDKESDLVVLYDKNGIPEFTLIEVKIDAAATENQSKGYVERKSKYEHELKRKGHTLLIMTKGYAGNKNYDKCVDFKKIVNEAYIKHSDESICLRSSFVVEMLKAAQDKKDNMKKGPENLELTKLYKQYFSLMHEYNKHSIIELKPSNEYDSVSNQREIMYKFGMPGVRIKHAIESGKLFLQFTNARKNKCVDNIVKMVESTDGYGDLGYIEPDYKSKGKTQFSF